MNQFNARSSQKVCAFCKHWYDPTNSAIFPKAPQIGVWSYDGQVEKKCLQKGVMKKGCSAPCGQYVCKI